MLKPIRSEVDYNAALARTKTLWGAPLGSAEGDELEALAILVEAYERKQWPTPATDPIEALRAHMDLNGFTRADLAQVLGSSSRASEVLNRKRALNLAMIRAISAAWGLPVSLLVAAYAVAA
jgi:antitoxin component HigA of HigAB toxin-antitoxin module